MPAPRRAREPVWVFLTSVAADSGYKALLFPKADEASVQTMMAGLMGKKQVESPETFLTLVANLDTKEAEHFGKLKQSAANELERRTEVKVSTQRKQNKLPNAEDLADQVPAAAKDPAAPGPAPGPKKVPWRRIRRCELLRRFASCCRQASATATSRCAFKSGCALWSSRASCMHSRRYDSRYTL